MSFESVAGGFKLSGEEKQFVNTQRALTKQVNDKFVQVGAIFLKTSSKNPFDPDGWVNTKHRDTNLQEWIDDPAYELHNVGFNLQLGWMDVDIDADDPEFNRCVIAAMDFLQIDTRFRFGRASVGCATHVLLQLGEDESANFDDLMKFEPKEFRLNDKRYHVQLRSIPTNTTTQNLVRAAKQTVMPGSIYIHKSREGAYDLSVWYGQQGPAKGIRDIAGTTPRKVNFNEVVRAITFATFLYVVRDQWVEGSRQLTATKVTGWLARVVADSAAMNNHEGIAKDVFCPVDSDDMAERLIAFVCDQQGDDEKHMRIRAYHDAREKLERNPDARVPGWPAMEQLFGGAQVVALRTVFMPGSDVSILTQMAERYVYDETDNNYIDRIRHRTTGTYIHAGESLERRHRGDTVRIGGKPREAFKIFESSDMRKRIGLRDLYPDLAPGGIYRISGQGEVLNDDFDDQSALTVFNTWRGWPIAPTEHVDSELLERLTDMLDKVLGWLTRDNQNQIEWVKDWIAWTFQKPGIKQQIAWVVVGDQGVGKSWIGNVFMQSLMGPLWGSASPKVVDTDFIVGPFVGKMFVFIDEAKFKSDTGTDEIKKLIRSVDVSGAMKFEDARNHRLFARVMFASNRLDMNIGQANTNDRALFYTRTYDREHTHLSEAEFRAWAETLKPFFDEFNALMARRDVKEHFMWYFMRRKCDRHQIESIKYSSSGDASIVLSNMGWARRVAKHIIEDARVFEDLDITFPFTINDLNKRVAEVTRELGMSNIQGARVLAEYQSAGVIESIVIGGQKKLRFTHKIATLSKLYGDAISVPLEARYVFTEQDEGKNECDGSTRPVWKGAKKSVVAGYKE
jgi:hypothetical protein